MNEHHDDDELTLEQQLDVAADVGGPLGDELARQVTLAAARASELRDVAAEVRNVAREVRELHDGLTDDLDMALVERVATVADRNTVRSAVAMGLAFAASLLAGLAVWIAAAAPHLPPVVLTP